MFSPADFHDLVSGRRRGIGPSLLRAALRIVEAPYTLAMRIRNRRYDVGKAKITQVGAPVISVGNLTLGGTGKTPFVAWLARWFRERNVRVAILSRGYRAEENSQNDEALELEERLPDVPHLQNPDRVASAGVAVEELDMQLLLLDDGFQHRRLARDLDIVLLDALDPFGCEHVFPRGMLREPVESLARADVVVLSRADVVDAEQRTAIRSRATRLAPKAIWCEVGHAPQGLRNSLGEQAPLTALAGKKIFAFCGIGNPEGFRRTLIGCGLDPCVLSPLPDHHAYTRDDITRLADEAKQAGAGAILCTHKDLVKLRVPRLGAIELWALHIDAMILAGLVDLETRLSDFLSPDEPADEVDSFVGRGDSSSD